MSGDYIRMTRRKDELRMKLNKLAKNTDKYVALALEKGANEVANTARGWAPVTDGGYASSIIAKPVDQEAERADQKVMTTWTGTAKRGKKTGQTVRRTAVADNVHAWGVFAAWYWRWIEYGTKAGAREAEVHTKSGKVYKVTRNHPGTPAVPHIFPAYRMQKRRIKGRITRAINKAAKEVAGGSK